MCVASNLKEHIIEKKKANSIPLIKIHEFPPLEYYLHILCL